MFSGVCLGCTVRCLCSLYLLQTSAQQALTGTINSSMQAVQAVQASLDEFDALPPLGTDAVRCIIYMNICFKCLLLFKFAMFVYPIVLFVRLFVFDQKYT